jgi:hypothetical protein
MKKSKKRFYEVGQQSGFVLNKDLNSFRNDPYFIKKTEKMKEMFLKYDIAAKLESYLAEKNLDMKEGK